ncbi:MAG: hypothetical protein IT372_31145, partial [Polyangiaceae bacterium]|nr:hypothetical protein [Polyangiaceae bacterium]
MRIGLGACSLGLAIAALAAGCGGGADATEKQLAELRAELARVRAASAALSERLDAVERTRAPLRGAAPRDAAEPDRPALDVVRLKPSADGAQPAQPDDGAAAAALPAEADDGGGERTVLRSGRGGEVIAEIARPARAGAQPDPKSPST